MSRIFVSGIAVLDFVFSVDEMPSEPIKYRALDAAITGGGCAAGAAVAIARLGGEAYLASRLGSDVVSDLIVQDLENEGVKTDCLDRAVGGFSSYSSIYVDRHGERQIVNYRGKGLTEGTDWLRAPEGVDVVLADTRWGDGVGAAMRIARKRDIPGIVDAEALMDGAEMQEASHVAFARRGLVEFTGEEDLAAGMRSAALRLPGWICVTDGAEGVYFLSNGSIEHIPGFVVDAVDTLGAGDVWHGAFALRIAEGADAADAIIFANAVAALKCTQFGGRSGCPDRPATEKFLKERKACN